MTKKSELFVAAHTMFSYQLFPRLCPDISGALTSPNPSGDVEHATRLEALNVPHQRQPRIMTNRTNTSRSYTHSIARAHHAESAEE